MKSASVTRRALLVGAALVVSLLLGPSLLPAAADPLPSHQLQAAVQSPQSDWIITTVAGSGSQMMFGRGHGDGGPALTANLLSPERVAVAPDGTIYLSEPNNQAVRKVTPDGVIHTVMSGCSPSGLTVDSSGALFVATVALQEPRCNSRVYRLAPGSDVFEIFAGTGEAGDGFAGDGGPASAARLSRPAGMAAADDGSLYVADSGNHRVRRIDSLGTINTIAGTGVPGFGGDGAPAVAASLNSPTDVALGPDGSVYVADPGNARVRRIRPDGVITTVAGNGQDRSSGDGSPALQASVSRPVGLAVSQDGTLFVAELAANRVRRIGVDGIISTLAGGGSNFGNGGAAEQSALSQPIGLAIGPDGALFIADSANLRIRKVAPPAPELPIPSQPPPPSVDSARIHTVVGAG